MNFRKSYFACIAFVLMNYVHAQNTAFQIVLEPLNISGLGGLQSFAYGQHNGKWLLVGGRLDGLHRRQPFAAFDQAGHNTRLIVVDPVERKSWSASLSSLPPEIREPLSATNMEFYQEGDYLYCLGGYGYSPTLGDHTTFDKLTVLNVPEIIKAIVSSQDFSLYFRQVQDPLFQVTGGKLKKIENNYYLLGGQKFIGLYNPMGPGHGPGFTQEYTNSIRIFSIEDDGVTIHVNHIKSWTDSTSLHRRDYNAESQILPDGKEGISMFSGVFQVSMDLPFLNTVTVDQSGFSLHPTFQQHYNHYHCAVLPMYSKDKNEMHNVFFGGIAQFYDKAGVLVQDLNVPFVKTIARVTRNAKGEMLEYKLPIEMPALLGAGSEFIMDQEIPHYKNGVLDFDQITKDSTVLGYIYGGISSTAENIFFTNSGNESEASSQVLKVYLMKTLSSNSDILNDQSNSTLKLLVFPNPTEDDFSIQFTLKEQADVHIVIFDLSGEKLFEKTLKDLQSGIHTYVPDIHAVSSLSALQIRLEIPSESAVQKIFFR